MAYTPTLPTYKCVHCGNEYPVGAGHYPIAPVRGWGGLMLCNICRNGNERRILAGVPTSSHLEAAIRARGIEPCYDDEGFLIVPDQDAMRQRRFMKVHIDHETDALYVRFSDDPVAETAEVRPGVMFDYDAQGRIVAMEFLDASKTVAAGDLGSLTPAVA